MKINVNYTPTAKSILVKWKKNRFEEALKKYGLRAVESKEKGRRRIDFRILDEYGNFCAEVSGDKPSEVVISCEHPATEFEDDMHVGECPICGAWATWHWQESADDGYTIKEQIVDTWDYQNVPGGIIGEHLKELQKGW